MRTHAELVATRKKLHPVLSLRVAPGTKLIWLYLKVYAAGGRQFRFNVAEAADDLGMSRNTVWRALLRLQDLGFIEWQRSKGGGRWKYDKRCGLIIFCDLEPTMTKKE
jgi:DNA-binding MarR family transcriptional regulator